MHQPHEKPIRLSHKRVIATQQATERAGDLRRNASAPEWYLWSKLKGRRVAKLRFRRQHPLGPYIADFYCHEAALVVEIDGSCHQGRGIYDRARDKWMRERGIEVLRFTPNQAFREIDSVLRTIATTAESRRTLSPPPPPAGEVSSCEDG